MAFCTSGQKSPSTKVERINKSEKTPEEVVLQFYNWYLKEIYLKSTLERPDVKLTKESIYQIVPKVQFDKLKKTGFFSDEFYKNELIIYNACNVQLRKVKIKDVDKCGCSPSEFVKNDDCDFLSYYPWTGGQGENLNKVTISKVTTSGDLSNVTAEISEANTPYSHPIVTLLKEDRIWKISKIELLF
jgi:hypothetical protein